MSRVSVVQSPTMLGVIVLAVALTCVAAAAAIAQRGRALPEPDLPEGQRIGGRVVSVVSSPCRTRPRGMTCHRPVTEYVAGGRTMEVVSRNAYTPNPYPVDMAVDVAVLPDGAVWLAPEWDDHIAAARDGVRQSRRRHYVFAALFAFCALLAGLLGAGMIWFVDTSDDPAATPPA